MRSSCGQAAPSNPAYEPGAPGSHLSAAATLGLPSPLMLAAGAALQALQTRNAAVSACLAAAAPPPGLAPQEHRCPAAQNSTSWCVPRMTSWINMMAGYLRSVDPNHMARARAWAVPSFASPVPLLRKRGLAAAGL